MINDQATRKRIRELRKRHGWTQQDLADRVGGIDRSAVANIERGKRGLSLDEAFRFALVLDVAFVHLVVPLDEESADDRAWFRGERPLAGQNPRFYYVERP